MPFTKEEQIRFEKMLLEGCRPTEEEPKKWIKKVADFIFELTGNVNFRMDIFNKYEVTN